LKTSAPSGDRVGELEDALPKPQMYRFAVAFHVKGVFFFAEL